MTAKEAVKKIAERHPWVNSWAQLGMVVCVTGDDKTLEIKQGQQLPGDIKTLGCGGWNESGQLFWVGIDIDVQHGTNGCASLEEAISEARRVRDFVNGAADIRLSKSGNGVHVRVRLAEKIMEGRKTAGNIAKWLAKTLQLKADASPLGRQNFWFWSKQHNEKSFNAIEECTGWWAPPPAALLEPEPEYKPAPIAPRAPQNDAMKRAAAYIAKIPGAVSGQAGHIHTFKVALQLVKGFGLTTNEARSLFYEWNRGCQPPWSEKELEHKLKQAAASTKVVDGFKLNERPIVVKPKKENKLAPSTTPNPIGQEKLSDRIKQQIQDEISGKRYAAAWPWPVLTWCSLALLPGTVTVICAPGGSAKSFFLIQCARFWMSRGYKTAIMELEENLTFHGRRALAQVAADGNTTDPGWTKDNPEIAPEIADQYAAEIDEFGQCLFEPAGLFDTRAAVGWVASKAAEGYRIIAIDPITAKEEGEKPWVDDKIFINGVKEVLKNANASLVLITHPPKNAKDTTLDNVAGGAAYQRFCQNIFYMQVQEAEEMQIMMGKHLPDEWMEVNRILYLRKLRNGRATNARIGFWFNPSTLMFEERGLIRVDALDNYAKGKN